MSLESLLLDYKICMKKTGSQNVAVALTLANAISELPLFQISEKDLGHNICMGIRYGLFGTGVSDNTSIKDIEFFKEEQ